MANNYFESEEFREILDAYEKSVIAQETVYFDEDDFADIADHYLQLDKSDLGMIAVEKGLACHKDSEVLLSMKSAILIYRRDFDQAIEIINNLDKNSSDIRYQLAQLKYAYDMDSEGAEKLFRKWMKAEDYEHSDEEGKREIYMHIISSFVELRGKDERGMNLWDVVMVRKWVEEYMSNFSPLGKYDTDIQVIDLCKDNDLADLMVKGLNEILEERPYVNKGWQNLALAYFTLCKYEQALEACDFALAINPNDKEALLTKAHSMYALNNKKGCIEYFQAYIENGGEPMQYVPLADCLFFAGKKDEAIAELRKFEDAMMGDHIDLSFNNDAEMKQAYIHLLIDAADLYFQNNCPDDAIRVYNVIGQVDETNWNAFFMVGACHIMKADLQGAFEAFDEAVVRAEDPVMVALDILMAFAFNNYPKCSIVVFDTVQNICDTHSTSEFAKNFTTVKSLCYLKNGDIDLFYENFKLAINESPKFVRIVYDGIFPEEMATEEWYDYAKNHIDEIDVDNWTAKRYNNENDNENEIRK